MQSHLLLIVYLILQDSISNPSTNNVVNEPEPIGSPLIMPLNSLEFYLSIIVLVFGLIVVFIEMHLIKVRQVSQEQAVQFIVITVIIVSTLFLITAGYNNNQIAPAVGLLGTIAGYLLGKINKKE